MDEFEMFLFDSDVALALMRGLSYEAAVEEAKQIRRDEREWQRLTKRAVDEGDSAQLQAESTPNIYPSKKRTLRPPFATNANRSADCSTRKAL